MRTYIGMIRAIGPETHKVMPMAGLRDGSLRAGLADVSTYIATGNLLFRYGGDEAAAAAVVAGVLAGFGLANPVFVRTPADLEAVLAACPFPDAAAERPERLLVSFMDGPAENGRIEALAAHPGPERVAAVGRELVIDYAEGIGRSKLTPAVVERRIGRPGTARNWTTVTRLADLGRRLEAG